MWPGGLLNYDDYPCSKIVPDVLRIVALMSILGFTFFILSNCVAVRTTLIIALAWSVKINQLDHFTVGLGCQLVCYVFCSKIEKIKNFDKNQSYCCHLLSDVPKVGRKGNFVERFISCKRMIRNLRISLRKVIIMIKNINFVHNHSIELSKKARLK